MAQTPEQPEALGARITPAQMVGHMAVAQKDVKFRAPWQMEPKTKTCGLPWLFDFEPHPIGPNQWPVQKMGGTLCLCKRTPGSNLLQQRGRVAHRLLGC